MVPQRLYLAVIGLTFVGFGLVFAVSPERLARLVDLPIVTASARTDIRAMYGGFELGFGVFLLVCLSRIDLVRIGLLAATCAFTGLATGRLAGLLTDGLYQPLNWLVASVEAAGAVFACLAFFTMRDVDVTPVVHPRIPPPVTPPPVGPGDLPDRP